MMDCREVVLSFFTELQSVPAFVSVLVLTMAVLK